VAKVGSGPVASLKQERRFPDILCKRKFVVMRWKSGHP